MTAKECKTIVNEYVVWLRWAMQLQDWTIDIEYCGIDKALGECTWNWRYRQATIRIDNEKFHESDTLLRVLRHELLHIMHAGYQQVTRSIPDLLEDVEKDANEELVRRMERMLDDGLGIGPAKMAAMSKLREKRKL